MVKKLDKKKLREMYWNLLEAGAGSAPTEMVFWEDDMFEKYLEWLDSGLSILEIASRFQEEWLKRNPSATVFDLNHLLDGRVTVEQLLGREKSPAIERMEKAIAYRLLRGKKREKRENEQ